MPRHHLFDGWPRISPESLPLLRHPADVTQSEGDAPAEPPLCVQNRCIAPQGNMCCTPEFCPSGRRPAGRRVQAARPPEYRLARPKVASLPWHLADLNALSHHSHYLSTRSVFNTIPLSPGPCCACCKERSHEIRSHPFDL